MQASWTVCHASIKINWWESVSNWSGRTCLDTIQTWIVDQRRPERENNYFFEQIALGAHSTLKKNRVGRASNGTDQYIQSEIATRKSGASHDDDTESDTLISAKLNECSPRLRFDHANMTVRRTSTTSSILAFKQVDRLPEETHETRFWQLTLGFRWTWKLVVR